MLAQDIKNAIKDDNKSAIYATNEYFSNMVCCFWFYGWFLYERKSSRH
nr:hypothetical protein [Mycoplasmopsis bovis]